MNNSRNIILFKNILVYALGNFGSNFIGFILLPFYTHYLSLGDYGYLGLINTTISFSIPLITFQIFDGLYRHLLSVKSEEEIKKVIASSFFRILINLVIFDLLHLLFIQFINFKYQYLILLQINFSIFYSFFVQSARGLKKNIDYSISGIITTIVLSTVSIVLIAFYSMKVDGIIIANICASIFSIIFLNYRIGLIKYIKYKFFDIAIGKKIVKYSIPLIPNAICWWIMNLSDRYMLSFLKGIESVGIYTVANKFSTLLVLVNSIFYLAWQESAITEYDANDKNEYYTGIFRIFMVLEFSTIFVLLTSTKFVMNIMVDEKYFSAWKYTPFLYFGAMFSAFSTFYGTGYQSSKETMGAFTTSVLGASINIIVNLLLIPIIGIQAASLSTMLAFLCMWIIRIIQTKMYFVIDLDKKKLFYMLFLSIFFFISVYYSRNIFFNYSVFALSAILFIFYNKDLLIKGISYAKYFKNTK